jgi:rhodanese-related sulfurtransferase
MTEPQLLPLSPVAASDMLTNDPRAVLIDIRSTMEFLFVGHPKGAIHVAWIDEPEWIVNLHFGAEVRKVVLGGISAHGDIGSAPVILICRSGNRSLDAGAQLLRGGFSAVYHVEQGFEGQLDEQHHRSTRGGWRYHGLAWEQC